MKKIRIESDPIGKRAAAYPATGDALDAIAKGFRALLDQNIQLPPATVAWVEACEGVKKRFRKKDK
jgi:hypothetical protein